MVLELLRTYFPDGTNGKFMVGNNLVAHTIELPWLENARNISCIPEGAYKLERRYSKKFKWHLLVKDVPGRRDIIIHPANDALKELRGCIAPVSRLTGCGKGVRSKIALEKILDYTFSAEHLKEEIELLITEL